MRAFWFKYVPKPVFSEFWACVPAVSCSRQRESPGTPGVILSAAWAWLRDTAAPGGHGICRLPFLGTHGGIGDANAGTGFLGKGLVCRHRESFSESCSKAVNLPFGAHQEGGSSLEKPWHWLRRSRLHCRHIILSLHSLFLLASFPFLSRSFFFSPLLSALQ